MTKGENTMKKRWYSRWVVLILCIALLVFMPFEVMADGSSDTQPASSDGKTDSKGDAAPNGDKSAIDWSQYSYDELLLIRDNLNDRIHEMERQYAIENGNRIITLSDSEVTLYAKKTHTLKAEVKRVVEDAPVKTTFKWTSSNESVAKVSNTGVVTGIGYGNATITCSATDDEYIFAESVFHVVLPVSGLTLDSANVTLLISEQNPADGTATLTCTVKPNNAHIKDVTWESSNPAVVKVDKKGVLKAVSAGTATITARSKDPMSSTLSATCKVTVQQAVNKITLSKTSLSLNINASETLTAKVLPEKANNKKVTWESSNPKVATVSSTGQVKAVAPGTAKISCTAADGSKVHAECTVTCIQMVTGIKFDVKEKTITLNKNKSTSLKTVITPENATNKSLTWKSSAPSIVSVSSDGKIEAKSGGAATITCTAKDGSKKSASIEVYVPSISVDKTEYTVTAKTGLDIVVHYYGQSKNFSYTATPTNLCGVKTKQNGDAITVSINPKKAGTVTIVLKDSADRRSERKITVTIDHSACYDTTSYPTGEYKKVLRKPGSYKDKKMSIYGRVLQKGTYWLSTYMRVATKGRYDDVFYVVCPNDLASSIIEDDYITVYGVCTGTETYTTVLGASITIPSIEAEKIVRGKK